MNHGDIENELSQGSLKTEKKDSASETEEKKEGENFVIPIEKTRKDLSKKGIGFKWDGSTVKQSCCVNFVEMLEDVLVPKEWEQPPSDKPLSIKRTLSVSKMLTTFTRKIRSNSIESRKTAMEDDKEKFPADETKDHHGP